MSVIGRLPAIVAFAVLLATPSFATERPADLRAQALEEVNADRTDHDLPPLKPADPLNEAAQFHAQDMLDRRYFEHVSPEGKNVQDRYLRFGGSRWRLVEENIAKCTNCSHTLNKARIEALEKGWMNSPEHRANILRGGLDRFGYGIAVDANGMLYAVQTFSGPGLPLGGAKRSDLRPIDHAKTRNLALGLVNDMRGQRSLPALLHSEALDGIAKSLLRQMSLSGAQPDLNATVTPEVGRQFKELRAGSAICGGCGTELVRADLDWLRQEWLKRSDSIVLAKSMTSFGFAASANGDGKKTAVAVVGVAR